jgi:tRNA(Ile)-lysidine synthase
VCRAPTQPSPANAGEGFGRPVTGAEFASLMAPLGPFGPAPKLVAGVSGGPHSLALALLAADWARHRGGVMIAAICDHGLREESAAEAAGVAATVRQRGIGSRVLALSVGRGPGLQERARAARLSALLGVCAAEGAPWLLLGHHRGDQAETVLLRALAGSGGAGLAGIPRLRATPEALVLRPLLDLTPERLEATVAAAGLLPLRDPSNADPRFTRVRLRPVAAGAEAVLAEAAARLGARRAATEAAVAARIAAAARLHPWGFARIDLPSLGRDAVARAALRALLRTVSGRPYPPPEEGVAALLARGEGTLAGAVLRRDGLLAREAAAVAPDIPAREGALWDGRFRLLGPGGESCRIGALGAAAARLPRPAWLPAAVARTLPAIRREMMLVAVPALSYPDANVADRYRMRFAPAGGPAS